MTNGCFHPNIQSASQVVVGTANVTSSTQNLVNAVIAESNITDIDLNDIASFLDNAFDVADPSSNATELLLQTLQLIDHLEESTESFAGAPAAILTAIDRANSAVPAEVTETVRQNIGRMVNERGCPTATNVHISFDNASSMFRADNCYSVVFSPATDRFDEDTLVSSVMTVDIHGVNLTNNHLESPVVNMFRLPIAEMEAFLPSGACWSLQVLLLSNCRLTCDAGRAGVLHDCTAL